MIPYSFTAWMNIFIKKNPLPEWMKKDPDNSRSCLVTCQLPSPAARNLKPEDEGVKPSFLVHTSIRSPCSSQKSQNIHPKPPPPASPPELFIDTTFILTEVIHEPGYTYIIHEDVTGCHP
jgi:hypothetical protein